MAVTTQAPEQAPERTVAGFRWWYLLTPAIPAAGILFYFDRFGGASESLTYWAFAAAIVSLIPLANWIDLSTEALSKHVSDRAAGLLDASFGNVPELAIGGFLLYHAFTHQESLLSDQEIIKGLIIGSVINNLLLVLGAAILVGALRHGRLTYSKDSASGFSSMLALAVVGLALPTLAYSFTNQEVKNSGIIEIVSLGVGVILIICYIAYIGASVFHWGEKEAEGKEGKNENAETATTAQTTGSPDPLGKWIAIISLFAASVATMIIAFVLVEETDVVVANTALTPLSVGLIIFPLFCNVGEFASVVGAAIRGMSKNKGESKDESEDEHNGEKMMDIAGSSAVQVPMLVAPLLVFISFAFTALSGGASSLDFVFQVFPLIAIGLVMIVYAFVSLDGESTWLEGLQLLAIYALIAVTAIALPGV